MSLIKKRVFSFFTKIVAMAFVMVFAMTYTMTVMAYEGQGEWFSNSSAPAVRVYIKGSFVYAQLSDRSLNLPATKLKHVSGNLLNEYAADYIKIQDFNRDRFSDIGVLKSVGYGGSNRCYAIFEYMPSFYSYKTRSTKTVCLD